MQIKPVLAFLGAAAISSVAFAAPGADGSTVIVRGDASQAFRLTASQAKDLNGSFRLDDGRELRLTSRNDKLFMEVGGKRQQLQPLSSTSFVAGATGARLELDSDAYPDTVRLTEFLR